MGIISPKLKKEGEKIAFFPEFLDVGAKKYKRSSVRKNFEFLGNFGQFLAA